MPDLRIGRFVDVANLDYRSATLAGRTNTRGEFEYHEGEHITFSIGDFTLGVVAPKPILTILDCLERNEDNKLLNRTRLLFSLTNGQGFEDGGMVITDKIRAAVGSRFSARHSSEKDFEDALSELSSDIEIPTKTIAHTQNHLRRYRAGFHVLRDIQIPVSNNTAHLLADLYFPLAPANAQHPCLLSSTIYGKRVPYSGPDLSSQSDIAAFEQAEHDWHTTTASHPLHVPNTGPWFHTWLPQRSFETIGTFNTFTYVPHGYAMLKIDPRGVSQTPGARGVPGQETSDLCEAVEWASKQIWCDGNVALAGNSYGANWQWAVAASKPAGLRCFVPFAVQVILIATASPHISAVCLSLRTCANGGVRAASPRWDDTGNIVDFFSSIPFDNEVWESMKVDVSKITLPVFMAASQLLVVHNRASYEVWREIGSKEKHLEIVDSDYYGWPNKEVAPKIIAFLDRHLKGKASASVVEAVGLQMRVGSGEWEWKTAENWPIPGTRYTKLHFHPDGTLSPDPPSRQEHGKMFRYSANPTSPKNRPAGVTFTSTPFAQDIDLAGHFSARLHISSSSPDADIVVQLWALSSDNSIVQYRATHLEEPQPLAFGLLRASHRKLCPEKSLPHRPYHTHRKEDYAPLRPGEIVEVDVEIFPATARIRKGWRLRVDITPSEEQSSIKGFQPPEMRQWDIGREEGAWNAVHVGGRDVGDSFVMLPAVDFVDRKGGRREVGRL